jgi:hypothetical protein
MSNPSHGVVSSCMHVSELGSNSGGSRRAVFDDSGARANFLGLSEGGRTHPPLPARAKMTMIELAALSNTA